MSAKSDPPHYRVQREGGRDKESWMHTDCTLTDAMALIRAGLKAGMRVFASPEGRHEP